MILLLNQTPMDNQTQSREKHVLAVLRSMKKHPEGCSDLFEDGVLRSFDGPFERNVIDAVGLSPKQIKQMLDMYPWSQEKEDSFRGVDGRKVVDYDALFHPPEKYRVKTYTEESLKKAQARNKEMNDKIREQIAKEEREGVNVAEKYACTRKVSDYDLSPRESSN